MALDINQLLMQLSPIQAGPVGGSRGGGDNSMELERLKLAKAQFEEQKKQNAIGNQMDQLRMDAQAAQEQARAQQAIEAREAAAQAELLKNRQGAQVEFAKLNAAGDFEGARAMVPYMSSLGMGVELEGEDGGMPRYRIDMDAEAAAAAQTQQDQQAAPYGPHETAEQSLSRLGAMGYPTNETGAMQAPLGIQSTDEIDPATGLSVAERVASTYGEQAAMPLGLDVTEALGMPAQEQLDPETMGDEDPYTKTPMVGPDQADMTGAVPSNVIDMGAIQAQTLQRLNPALSGIIAGLPEEYRGSAESTASGVAQMGLPAEKALDAYGKFQGQANALIQDRLSAQEEEAKQRYAAKSGSDKEGFDRYKAGFDTLSKEVASKYDVQSRLRTRGIYKDALDILDDDTPENDMLIVPLIARAFGERGASSDRDMANALGLPATSTIDQITDWVQSRLYGGMREHTLRALRGVVTNTIDTNDSELSTFSTRLLELADDPETDKDVAKGVRDYWRATVPADMREKMQKERQQSAPQSQRSGDANTRAPGESSGPGELEYLVDAEASISGLDPAAINQVIQGESGGNPAARNPSGATGLIQFMPATAKNLGTTTDEIATMPLEDQVRLVVKYFENAGITADSPADDYAVAVAAPAFVGKPDTAVVYKTDSKAWEQNPPWRPADGGPITVGSIKAYYRKKNAGKSSGGETASAEQFGPPPPPADPAAARRARIEELSRKAAL